MTWQQLGVCIFFGLIVYGVGFKRGLDEGAALTLKRIREAAEHDE